MQTLPKKKRGRPAGSTARKKDVAAAAAVAAQQAGATGDDATGKLRRQPMSDEAYQVIKKGILTNKYPGGFQIFEDELASSLQMSRTPVREALLKLESEGLIELVPRRGVRVVPLSLDDIREAYQLLGFMETAAAEMISQRPDHHADVAALQASVDEMQSSLKRDDIAAWAEADERFHRQLVNLSGNKRLARIANTLLDQTERFRRFTMRLRKKPTHFASTHFDLVQRIRARDVDGIREVHLGHKARWLDEMSELVKRLEIVQI